MSKEKIFALLSAQAGVFVSGEDISAQLGISRAAVWKAVGALRRDGYTGSLTVEAKCEPHEDEDFIESVGYLNGLLAVPAGV